MRASRPGDVTERADVLRRQWGTLRAWVGNVVAAGDGGAPSILDGWTVADLVAHLGRAMSALAACEPAPAGTVPLTLAEYLGTYAGRAADIDRVTRELAGQIADDPLRHVDALVAEAFARVDALGPADVVVQARRGPVLLSTMIASRLTELVVHAEHRGGGVGGEILDRLVAWSRERGVHDVQLFAARGRAPFYERHGFRPRPTDAPGMDLAR